jgi:Mg2+/citrate symporter
MPAHDDVPRPVRWPGRPLRWPTRIPAALFLAAAAWRLLVAFQKDDSGFGEAQRAHLGLLLLQAVCALVAAGCVIGVTDAVQLRERRLLTIYVVLLVLAAGAFLAIFAKNGLLDWGAYED